MYYCYWCYMINCRSTSRDCELVLLYNFRIKASSKTHRIDDAIPPGCNTLLPYHKIIWSAIYFHETSSIQMTSFISQQQMLVFFTYNCLLTTIDRYMSQSNYIYNRFLSTSSHPDYPIQQDNQSIKVRLFNLSVSHSYKIFFEFYRSASIFSLSLQGFLVD